MKEIFRWKLFNRYKFSRVFQWKSFDRNFLMFWKILTYNLLTIASFRIGVPSILLFHHFTLCAVIDTYILLLNYRYIWQALAKQSSGSHTYFSLVFRKTVLYFPCSRSLEKLCLALFVVVELIVIKSGKIWEDVFIFVPSEKRALKLLWFQYNKKSWWQMIFFWDQTKVKTPQYILPSLITINSKTITIFWYVMLLLRFNFL